MPKLSIFLFLFSILNYQIVFAENHTLNIYANSSFQSGKSLGSQHSSIRAGKSKVKFNLKYDSINSSLQLALNYDKNKKLIFDDSYLQASYKNVIIGVGMIDRLWSFSDRTSLILSDNARPSEAIYLKFKNEFKKNWLPSNANWSFEIFNGNIKGNLKGRNSMLLGMRAILTPIEGLNFEMIQTSQWGGMNYSKGLSAFRAALIGNTNESSNSNINKMAGVGVSYLNTNKIIPLRVYGQAIGEDEAGSLPSCYAYLVGVEYSNLKIKYPITLGIEAVDTRVNKTTHGNCGPNTFYNNSVYSYTNYGDTIGSDIDTEGVSLEFFGKSKISQKIDIDYSTKVVIINDSNWSNHRLSSKRQSGLINSIGASWSKNDISFTGNVYHQNFNLNKTEIKKGLGVNFSTSITF